MRIFLLVQFMSIALIPVSHAGTDSSLCNDFKIGMNNSELEVLLQGKEAFFAVSNLDDYEFVREEPGYQKFLYRHIAGSKELFLGSHKSDREYSVFEIGIDADNTVNSIFCYVVPPLTDMMKSR